MRQATSNGKRGIAECLALEARLCKLCAYDLLSSSASHCCLVRCKNKFCCVVFGFYQKQRLRFFCSCVFFCRLLQHGWTCITSKFPMSTRSRRQQNRLQGSGRVTTRRPFKLSRVNQFAIKVPKRRKDTEDEFENVDQFFQDSSAASTPGSALTAGSPASSGNEATTAGRGGRRRSTSGKKKSTTKPRRTPTPRTASPKKRLSFAGSRRESVATPGDFDASEDGGQFSDDGIEFDSGGDQQSDEGEEPTPEPTPKPKASKGGRRKAAKAKKVSLATPDARSSRPGRKRKTPVPRTFTTPDANLLDNSVVEDAPDNLQPLEPDPPTPGVRRSKRVRYKPLAHWKNERITTTVTHTASGGIALKTKAQRDGVPTPVIKRARNQGGASTPYVLPKPAHL